MYFYQVGYSSMEESPTYDLWHEILFSKEEFQKICIEGTIEVYKKRIAVDDYDRERLKQFDSIYDEVAEYIIEKYNFKPLIYNATFTPFGWASMFDKTDWKGQRGKTIDAIADAFNAAGFGPETGKPKQGEAY